MITSNLENWANGICIEADEELRGRLKDFRMTSDDVLVIGYPRSGTMWMQEMVYQLHHPNDKRTGSERPCILSRVKQLDYCGPGMTAAQHVEDLQNQPAPRLYKTHLWPCFLDEIVEGSCKMVLMLRNPKDTMVSLYHYYLIRIDPFEGSWDEFFDTMVVPWKVLYGDWFEYVSQWMKVFHSRPNTLVVKYEDVKERPVEQVSKLAELCNLDLSDDVLKDIATRMEFSKSKKSDSLGLGRARSAGYGMDFTKFMRKGIVGDWRGYFNQKQSEYFDERLEHLERETGLKFEM